MSKCLTPYIVDNGEGWQTPVPCGKCPDCLQRRMSGWAFRLLQQDKVSNNSYFLTLTYDNKHAKETLSGNGFLSLQKRDIQLFLKRLRKAHDSLYKKCGVEQFPRIRYFAVGEYGSRNRRPHYHLIIFNIFPQLVMETWQNGEVFFGTVTDMSVTYTLKYMCKQTTVPMHRNDDRQKEFQLMSKGLGLSYITPKMIRWHMADVPGRMYCNLPDGKKCTLPRYYRQKIYDYEAKLAIKAFYSALEVQHLDREGIEAALAKQRIFNLKSEQNRYL